MLYLQGHLHIHRLQVNLFGERLVLHFKVTPSTIQGLVYTVSGKKVPLYFCL